MKESAFVVLLLLFACWEGWSLDNACKKSSSRLSSLNVTKRDTEFVNGLNNHAYSTVFKFQHELIKRGTPESPPTESIPFLPPYKVFPKEPTADNVQPSRYHWFWEEWYKIKGSLIIDSRSRPSSTPTSSLLPSSGTFRSDRSQNDSVFEPLAQQKSGNRSVSRLYDSKLFAEDG